ncbi:MAG: hypothetical protein LUG16_01140 [Candidatus Gastranaerophilales bacterium]|nr:hypothetical protein [Candidatus Gastranaerophilales bacterium]
MCLSKKITTIQTDASETEVIENATQADASVQKASAQTRTNAGKLVSENLKTSNNGVEDEIQTSKKKLLGE